MALSMMSSLLIHQGGDEQRVQAGVTQELGPLVPQAFQQPPGQAGSVKVTS